MRIAIWIHGGIGGGHFSQGHPPLRSVVEGISELHQVTVYSILPANKDFRPHIRFRSPTRIFTHTKIRSVLLAAMFIFDHGWRPFHLLHAWWAYPAGTLAVRLGRLCRTRTLVTLQGGEAAHLPEINYGNMRHSRLKKITLRTCERATHLHAVSSFLVNSLKQHGLQRDDASVVPLGPDLKRFTYKPKVRTATLRLIHVANLTEVKDQKTLIEAFEIIASACSAELRIVGADYLRGQLQKQVALLRQGNRVLFTGPLPQDELRTHYEWADMMLHPSLHEGQAAVVAEAMAMGVVVCGTKVGIIHDLGDEYFGVAPARDPRALAAVTLNLWRHEEELTRKRDKCLQWIRQHDLTWTVGQFDLLYRNLYDEKA